ncbi:MAG TPA: hypothetical protein VKU19_25030 [Bryobacteraceae bacterium]|nr:hypothetical protein [Bryobacteraceae bacterium]
MKSSRVLPLLLLHVVFVFGQVVLPGGPSPAVSPPSPQREAKAGNMEAVSAAEPACTIELKSGERIEGKLKQVALAGAVIEVAGQAITVPLVKVGAIYFGHAPSLPVAAMAPFQEAIDALTSLRSVTNSGIAYRDYSQRVLDAKVKVDRYLSSPESGGERRNAIRVAMIDYEFASRIWLVRIQNDYSQWSRIGLTTLTPDLTACSAVTSTIDKYSAWSKTKDRTSNDYLTGLGLRMSFEEAHVPELWACASEQIAKAERLAAAR